MEFTTTEETLRFRSPLAGMALVEQRIQRRQDPLLGHWAVGSSGMVGKAQFVFNPFDREHMTALAARTERTCLFCPQRVEQVTPRYPDELIPGGCMRRGECFLFPNLFPVAPVHAVVALGGQHYRELPDFPATLLADGLALAIDFARRYRAAVPTPRFFSVSGNYLPPAGASQVHPHVQVLGGRHPATAVERLRQASLRWREEHGAPYFEQLLAHEEAAGERWVGRSGESAWLTAFAPLGAMEVLGVLPGVGHLVEVGEQAVADLARGLSAALAHYGRLGLSTFNFSLFSDACDGEPGTFPVFLRLICRQNVAPDYRADDYFVQRLLGEELMVTLPEDLAEGMRTHWELA